MCNLDILVAYRIPVPGGNTTRQTHPETTTTTPNDHPLATIISPTVQATEQMNEEQMHTSVPIPSISATVKDEEYSSVQNDDEEDRRSAY